MTSFKKYLNENNINESSYITYDDLKDKNKIIKTINNFLDGIVRNSFWEVQKLSDTHLIIIYDDGDNPKIYIDMTARNNTHVYIDKGSFTNLNDFNYISHDVNVIVKSWEKIVTKLFV